MVMPSSVQKKDVGVAELKARLSEHLRAVRRGHTVVVTDHDTPIARLVPYDGNGETLSTRKPARLLRDVAIPRPGPGEKGTDIVALLLADRRTG